ARYRSDAEGDYFRQAWRRALQREGDVAAAGAAVRRLLVVRAAVDGEPAVHAREFGGVERLCGDVRHSCGNDLSQLALGGGGEHWDAALLAAGRGRLHADDGRLPGEL